MSFSLNRKKCYNTRTMHSTVQIIPATVCYFECVWVILFFPIFIDDTTRHMPPFPHEGNFLSLWNLWRRPTNLKCFYNLKSTHLINNNGFITFRRSDELACTTPESWHRHLKGIQLLVNICDWQVKKSIVKHQLMLSKLFIILYAWMSN